MEKLVYGDKSQSRGYFLKGILTGKSHWEGEFSRRAEMFSVLIWVVIMGRYMFVKLDKLDT